jgi:biotin carboxyl carrier protein
MKYEAEIDGRAVTVELEQRDGRVSAKIGERAYEVEVTHPEAGVYLLFWGDQVYEVRLWSEANQTLRINLRDRRFTAKVIDRRQRRLIAEQASEGRQQLIAPMPGKVVRVLLEQGAEVAAGQGVVVVEAMKMQNEIKSPKAGHVLEVRVKQGATVTAGQVLAVVE